MQRTWMKLLGAALLILAVMGMIAPLVAAKTYTQLDSPTGESGYVADPDDTFGTGGPFPDPPYPDPMPPPPPQV